MMNSFLDQKPVRFPEEKEFLILAEKGLGDSLEEGLSTAERYAQVFVSMEEGSGLGLSAFLHGVNFRWEDFKKEEGDAFWKWADRATGKAVATVQRRVCVWEWLTGEYIPEDFSESIGNYSVKMLSRAYRVSLRHKKNKYTGRYDFEPSGYEIEPADWLSLSECVDEAMLSNVIDKITGREPNSNRISFKLEDTGEIWFYRGKKSSAVVGELFVNSDSSLVRDGAREAQERLGATEFNEP